MTACDRCHSRKTRCGQEQPECGSCLRSGVRCTYPEKLHYRHARRLELESLQERVRSLQRENEALRSNHASDGTRTSDDSAHSNGLRQSDRARAHSTQQLDTNNNSNNPLAVSTSSPPPSEALSWTPLASEASRKPASHGKYLGSSAGANFIDLVESVFDDALVPAGETSSAGVSQAYSRSRLANDTVSLSASMPDRRTASRLVASYFDHWHVTFPLLYRPSFTLLVERIYSSPKEYLEDRSSAFVFNMVLALGSAAAERFEWSYKDTESYSRQAMVNFYDILRYRDLRSLQALLLCCQYGIHASLRDTADEMWDLLGKAERICVEIGLHQSVQSARSSRSDYHLTGLVPMAVRAEMQKRCFWCFYSLDRIVSVTLGRTLTLSDDDIDTPLPSPLDDDELENQSASSTDNTSAVDANEHERISPFLRLIYVRRLLAKSHRLLHTNVAMRALQGPEKRAIRQNLLSELQDWRQTTANAMPRSSNDESSLAISAFHCASWWEAVYHNAVLVLFRPPATTTLVGTAAAGEGQTMVQDHQDSEAEDVLKIMWETSRKLISNYREVLQARRLNYSWICLYTIFMAGLTNVYSVGQWARRRKLDPGSFLPPCSDVMTDIKNCSNILTAICERWDDARQSCEIFSRLSDSAFKELFRAHLASATAQSQSVQQQQQQPPGNPVASGHSQGGGAGAGATGLMVHGSSVITHTELHAVNSHSLPALHQDARVDDDLGPYGFQDHRNGNANANGQQSSSNSMFDDLDGFQHTFQDMQNALYGGTYDGSSEIMTGLARNWFDLE
ncbi:hypothetical protein LTR67_001779 [Exophiala xenobiotica]